MSGHQSSSVALLDAHKSGVVISSILHRDQARVYVKQLTDGVPIARALARGAGGGRHRARGRASTPPPSVRVAFLGPAGTFTEEALRASAPDGAEPVAYPTVYETVMAVHDGQTDRALVPIENSLEGGVAATLDALATEASDVRIVAEHIHPIHHCLIARRRARAGGRDARHLPPPGDVAVRRAPARARSRARNGCRASPPPRPRARSPSPTSRGRRSRRAWPPSSTAASSCAPTSRTRATTRPASSGSRRPPPAPARAGRQDVDRLLGLQRRVARGARERPPRAVGPRDQPDADRVAAAARRAGPLHVLRRPRGRRRGAAGSPRPSTRCAHESRNYACSARTRPPDVQRDRGYSVTPSW